MPDWKKYVRKRMAALPHDAKEEVIAELTVHLEEIYEQARATGVAKKAAIRIALQEVADWRALSENICCAKQENAMNRRTKTLWLPGIALLFSVGLVLLFLDRAPNLQRLIWIACMGLLFGTTASEANHLNMRTKSLWLPGFVSLFAASLFMLAEEIVLVHDTSFYFTEISLRPSHLFSGLPLWFYIAWLLAQAPCGALGAFLSRRSGGSQTARIAAGAFPALAMFLLCGLVIPISAFFERSTFASSHPSGLAFGILIWAVAPAITLMLGAAPFLKGTNTAAAQMCRGLGSEV